MSRWQLQKLLSKRCKNSTARSWTDACCALTKRVSARRAGLEAVEAAGHFLAAAEAVVSAADLRAAELPAAAMQEGQALVAEAAVAAVAADIAAVHPVVVLADFAEDRDLAAQAAPRAASAIGSDVGAIGIAIATGMMIAASAAAVATTTVATAGSCQLERAIASRSLMEMLGCVSIR